ncbi:hypothetical protein E2C01_081856 [Portunus trituberculatus]|uniref:Uncharacterized protein n=1 Tax=Portunus trituberculatus TaxID=210409 RepID=A0A5B7J283_PORTR|nr:hypothetical protein [Portunus trituberculatus]
MPATQLSPASPCASRQSNPPTAVPYPRPSRHRLCSARGRWHSGKQTNTKKNIEVAKQVKVIKCCVRRARAAAGQRVYPVQGQQHADITTASGEQRRQQQQQPHGHTGSGTGQQVGDDCPVRHMTRALFLPPSLLLSLPLPAARHPFLIDIIIKTSAGKPEFF